MEGAVVTAVRDLFMGGDIGRTWIVQVSRAMSSSTSIGLEEHEGCSSTCGSSRYRCFLPFVVRGDDRETRGHSLYR